MALVHPWAEMRAMQKDSEMTKAASHEYERRMNNWRMWRISDGKSRGGSPFPVYNLTPRPPRGENIMPILAGEAEETDQAVRSLPTNLLRAIEIWYLTAGTVNAKRKMLGCRRERMMQMLEEARLLVGRRLRERSSRLRSSAGPRLSRD